MSIENISEEELRERAEGVRNRKFQGLFGQGKNETKRSSFDEDLSEGVLLTSLMLDTKSKMWQLYGSGAKILNSCLTVDSKKTLDALNKSISGKIHLQKSQLELWTQRAVAFKAYGHIEEYTTIERQLTDLEEIWDSGEPVQFKIRQVGDPGQEHELGTLIEIAKP